MFKCKQCGRGFSANIPSTCPDCGAVNRQPDSAGSGRFWVVFFLCGGFDLLIFAIMVGIVVAVATKFL